jgi:hypothetical protein
LCELAAADIVDDGLQGQIEASRAAIMRLAVRRGVSLRYGSFNSEVCNSEVCNSEVGISKPLSGGRYRSFRFDLR